MQTRMDDHNVSSEYLDVVREGIIATSTLKYSRTAFQELIVPYTQCLWSPDENYPFQYV